MVSKKINQLTPLVFSVITTSVFAQTTPGSITNLGGGVPGGSVVSTNQNIGAPASETTEAGTLTRAWSIKPRIGLTETLTDNAALNRAQGNKEGDLITQLTPGIRIEGQSARLKAYLDYALNAQTYAKSDHSRTQNNLNSFATLEAVDN